MHLCGRLSRTHHALKRSTAASLSGCLLAVGGHDDQCQDSPAVHVFQPQTTSWVRMTSGDLPVAVCAVTAIQLPDNELFICSGYSQGGRSKGVFIGSMYTGIWVTRQHDYIYGVDCSGLIIGSCGLYYSVRVYSYNNVPYTYLIVHIHSVEKGTTIPSAPATSLVCTTPIVLNSPYNIIKFLSAYGKAMMHMCFTLWAIYLLARSF